VQFTSTYFDDSTVNVIIATIADTSGELKKLVDCVVGEDLAGSYILFSGKFTNGG
jgi:hypothetical protein